MGALGQFFASLSPRFAQRASKFPTMPAELATAAEFDLTRNILPFWLAHARNPETGGFWGEISSDMRKRKAGPRGALLTARILWTFSAAYRREPNPAWLEMARYAYDDLTRNFLDPEHGGLYWSLKASGEVVHAHKHVYIQAFGIYGLAEYHRASGDAAALEQAWAIYRLIEAHAADPVHGGYFEALTRDWSERQSPLPQSISQGADKSQNTMLHVMEAYTLLLEVSPDSRLKAALTTLCENLVRRIFNPASAHLGLFFDADWTPRSERYSPGHDIECSWLLTRAAKTVADPALIAEAKVVSLALAEASLSSLDAEGAMIYEAGPGGAADPQRQWWVEAEAVVGFLDAYALSGETRFYKAALGAWQFIERRMIDRRNGEWFGDLTGGGEVIRQSPKLGFWKCPYHNARACMEIAARAGRIDPTKLP